MQTLTGRRRGGAAALVLRASDLGLGPGGAGYEHVNDPSVTVHADPVSGRDVLTMFFTACRNPCDHFGTNELWWARSLDGRVWSDVRPLLADDRGPAEPSAVVFRARQAHDVSLPGALGRAAGVQPQQLVWRVYFTFRADRCYAGGACVGSTTFASIDTDEDGTVLRSPDDETTAIPDTGIHGSEYAYGGMANPQVGWADGRWLLTYNVYWDTRGDIYVARGREPNADEDWLGGPPLRWEYATRVLEAAEPGAGACSLVGPFLREEDGRPVLWFGAAEATVTGSDGARACDTSRHRSLQRWVGSFDALPGDDWP